MTRPEPDGSLPLLRFSFNLTANETQHIVQPGETNGCPAISFDSTRNRIRIDFVRRKASANPGIIYQVEFSSDLTHWTTNASLLSTTPIDSIWERVCYEDSVSRSQADARFSRVTVSK